MRGVIGQPEPTKEQWLTSHIKNKLNSLSEVTGAETNREIARERSANNQPGPYDPYTPNEDDQNKFELLKAAVSTGRGARGNSMPAGNKAIMSRLDDDHTGGMIQRQIAATRVINQRNEENFKKYSKITDRDSAIDFITNGLGYNMNPNRDGMSRFTGHALTPEEKRYYTSPPGGGSSRRHIPHHLLERIPEERKEQLKGVKDDIGIQSLKNSTIINDIPWELASELYEMFDNRSDWNNFGLSAGARNTIFNPTDPEGIKYNFDENGNFTSTSFGDKMASLQGEELESFMKQNQAPRGNKNRGIAMLQLILATAGVDTMSGLPYFISPRYGTIDHGSPTSKTQFPESIDNFLPALGGPNQLKSDDTFADMMSGIEEMGGAGAKITGNDWASYPDFNLDDPWENIEDSSKKKPLNIIAGEGLEEMFPLIKDIATERDYLPHRELFGEPEAKQLISDLRHGRMSDKEFFDLPQAKFHQAQKLKSPTIADLGDQIKEGNFDILSDFLNQWISPQMNAPGSMVVGKENQASGGHPTQIGPGIKNDTTFQALRKALMWGSLKGDGLRKELQSALQDPSYNYTDESHRSGASRKRAAEKLKRHMDNHFKTQWGDPIRARVQSWAAGLVPNEEFLGEMNTWRQKALESIRETVTPEVYQQLSDAMFEEQNNHGSLVSDAMERKGWDKDYWQELDSVEGDPKRPEGLREKSITPVLKDDQGNFTINKDFISNWKSLFSSQYGRDKVEKMFPHIIQNLNEAVKTGDPEILKFINSLDGKDMGFSSLIGESLMLDPTSNPPMFTEQLELW